MTVDEFKKIVNYFGEKNIIGISFNDYPSIAIFIGNEFSLANNYISSIECLQFVNFDLKGNPFHVIRPVDTVQSFFVRDSNVDVRMYDRSTVRG